MDKKILSFFTFGLLLIVIGAIGKLLKWNQANIILALGLVFETLAILMIAWNKIRKNG
ncbi:MAG: hypothetical protein ABFR05_02160 [Bacteroidota bacterium]